MINKTKIKKLAKDSFEKKDLDPKKVDKISKLLDKNSLKEYVKDLKAIQKRKTIVLVVPSDKIGSVEKIGKQLETLYPDKRVVVEVDPTLIAGIKVINDDLVYEFSVQNMLEESLGKI